MAFAEAAGWLASAADRAWIHPRDLAFAEAGLLGDFAAAALGGRGAASLPATAGGLGGPGRGSAILLAEADRLPDSATLGQGLALARALRRLASQAADPCAAPAALLQPLAIAGAPPLRLRPERLAAWRQAALDLGLPPLLAAGAAAAGWMAAGILEDSLPRPAQALLLAAAVLRRRGRLRAFPCPSGRSAAAAGRTCCRCMTRRLAGGLPRACGYSGAAGARRARPAARGRSRRAAPGRGGPAEPTAGAVEAALRAPAVTARGLARQLGITPQGALQLINLLLIIVMVEKPSGGVASGLMSSAEYW